MNVDIIESYLVDIEANVKDCITRLSKVCDETDHELNIYSLLNVLTSIYGIHSEVNKENQDN